MTIIFPGKTLVALSLSSSKLKQFGVWSIKPVSNYPYEGMIGHYLKKEYWFNSSDLIIMDRKLY